MQKQEYGYSGGYYGDGKSRCGYNCYCDRCSERAKARREQSREYQSREKHRREEYNISHGLDY